MEITPQTARLFMREFTLADAEILYQMHQDPATTKYIGDPIPMDNIDIVKKIIAEALMPTNSFFIEWRHVL